MAEDSVTREAKSSLLHVVAEGRPYVFLTLGKDEEDGQEYIEVAGVTDIHEAYVVDYILKVAREDFVKQIDPDYDEEKFLEGISNGN